MRLWPRRRRSLQYVLAWCDCGAQMACDDANRRADCSDILLGVATAAGTSDAMRHSDVMPYAFWKLHIDKSGRAPIRREPRNQEGRRD